MMTAKEKANELVNKFYQLRAYEVMEATQRRVAFVIAKESAGIYVDGMIKELVLLQINEFHDAWVVNRVNFWNEVKQELDKI